MTVAIVCPGQGSQRPGMLSQWLAGSRACVLGPLMGEMSDAAGLDLSRLGTEAVAEEIRPTQVAQPLTLATSLASAVHTGLAEVTDGLLRLSTQPLTGRDEPCLVAGHSLGYLTALALAGALSIREAAHLARVRGLAMARCSVEHPGSMVALVAKDLALALAAIEAAGLEAANINGHTQVVASGSVEALAAFEPPAGVRALPLDVAGAFHTQAMSGACPEVRAAVHEILEVGGDRRLRCALVDDATGQIWEAGESARLALEAVESKITQPVRWDLVQAVLAQRARSVCELAPARALTGFARRDMPGVEILKLAPSNGV